MTTLEGMFVILFIYLNLLDNCWAGHRIIGGRRAEIKDFPYQLSLRYDNRHICGAALISRNVALSAAHCFPNSGSYSVRAGSTQLYGGGQVVPVTSAILHPYHNPENQDYDIAVLILGRNLRFSSTIQPVKLPQPNEVPQEGWIGSVTGWGTTTDGSVDMSDTLRIVKLPVLSKDWCQNRYLYVPLTRQMFCAGYKDGGRDSCQTHPTDCANEILHVEFNVYMGDSGGPFVINGTLYGIVSWGFNCASPGYPGVYTNVASLRYYIKKNCNI